MLFTRRQGLTGLAAALTALSLPAMGISGRARASERPLEISWRDLIPVADRGPDGGLGASGPGSGGLSGVVPHGALPNAPAISRPPEETLRQELDGLLVKLPGYALPLEMENVGVTEFLLVPYIGACIHVPPPPPNQMVLVKLSEPFVFNGLFEPVWASGTLEARVNQVAGWLDVGYRLTTAEIAPYEFRQ